MPTYRSIPRYVLLALFIAAAFSLQPFRILGGSMYPTLHNGDILVVETLSKHVLAPRRGELIIFRNPHRMEENDVKRVIGLPGETVHVRRDRVVVDRACDMNGIPVVPTRVELDAPNTRCRVLFGADTFLGGGAEGDNTNEFDMFLGPHDFFVLGDDRRDSSDSRIFGAVQPENIIGRPLLRIWPPSRFSFLLGTVQ